MKSVLISIQPKWVEKIVSGEKTMEVRKTRPKLETPFKCYIYCTSANPYLYKNPNNGELFLDHNGGYRGGDYEDRFLSGKVIGEFVCDMVEKFNVGSLRCDDIEELACLSYREMINYFYNPEELDGKTAKQGYSWHISDLKIYDKPKELSEFNRPCVSVLGDCEDCICGKTSYTWDFDEKTGKIYCTRRLSKAPQSWCYVEVKE